MENQKNTTSKETLISLIQNINIKYKIAFFSCLIFGFFSQATGLFNKISFNDDILFLFDIGATYTSGRWGLEILKNIIRFIFGSGTYSLPVFNGFSAIIFLSITACLIIDLLNIKNQLIYIFISGLLVCFPVITYLFGYMFTLPYYMLSVLFGTWGVYIICKCKQNKQYILGILLITLSIGIYQAFLPFTISLFVLYLINFIATETQTTYKEIFRKLVIIFVSITSSIILYLCITKLYLAIHQTQLTDYREINTLGLTTFSGYMFRILFAYKEYFWPTPTHEYYMYPANTKYIYYVCICLSIIMASCITVKIYKQNKIRALLLSIIFICFPLAVNLIFVMSPLHIIHALMMYSQLIPFILFAWLIDNIQIKTQKVEKFFKHFAFAILILLNIIYCRYANECYLKATLSQQRLISYYTTLITQIKSIEEYSDNLPIMFINEHNIKDRTLENISELQLIQGFPYKNIKKLVNNHAWKNFMKYWLGYSPTIVNNSRIKRSAEVRKMPSYPTKGSIKRINNVIVVKF